jgi:hypothetical protein
VTNQQPPNDQTTAFSWHGGSADLLLKGQGQGQSVHLALLSWSILSLIIPLDRSTPFLWTFSGCCDLVGSTPELFNCVSFALRPLPILRSFVATLRLFRRRILLERRSLLLSV